MLLGTALAAAAIAAQAADYSTAPVAAGIWTYRALPGGSEARFIDSTNTARLTIRCTRMSRQVNISHTSAIAAANLLVWTSSASRTVPVRFEPNAMRVTADFSALDPLLDAIAFSRGRVVMMLAGGVPLVVPAWPEAARTVEDCRI